MSAWNVDIYSKFLDLRTRPARDLLAAIPASFQPKIVYDLGCGPGNSTVLLKNRWPEANVTGVDSSAEMLKKASSEHPDICFTTGDIEHFSSSEKVDCLFANASLHWCDTHEILIPKLVKTIHDGGFFAMQMPNNFHAPTHQVAVQVLQSHAEWHQYLDKLIYGPMAKPRYLLSEYYDLLTVSGMHAIQCWETEYYQKMPNYRGIFDWVSGTVLRSLLAKMDDVTRKKFADAYVDTISNAYPLQADGSVLPPFRRVFVVAAK